MPSKITRNIGIKNIYYFILKINSAIGLSFFYSQCYIHKIIKTYFANFFYKLDYTFEPTRDNIKIQEYEINQLYKRIKSTTPRIYNDYYTLTNLDYIPDFFKKIIEKHKKQIEKYLGKNFVFEKITYSLTKKIPKNFESFDVYANLWHQDSDSFKLIKIFVLINNVSIKDGPLTFLSEKKTKENWFILRERFGNYRITKIKGEQKFTGSVGDYIIIDTARNLHRASNPKNYREMLTIALYPKWSNISDVKRYRWDTFKNFI